MSIYGPYMAHIWPYMAICGPYMVHIWACGELNAEVEAEMISKVIADLMTDLTEANKGGRFLGNFGGPI